MPTETEIAPEEVIRRMRANADLLGACWRGDWMDFDGRTLRAQLEDLDWEPNRFAISIGACIDCRSWTEHCKCHKAR